MITVERTYKTKIDETITHTVIDEFHFEDIKEAYSTATEEIKNFIKGFTPEVYKEKILPKVTESDKDYFFKDDRVAFSVEIKL